MSTNHPECPDSTPDRSVAADARLRQERGEEEDEEDDDDDGKEDDDDGYSE